MRAGEGLEDYHLRGSEPVEESNPIGEIESAAGSGTAPAASRRISGPVPTRARAIS